MTAQPDESKDMEPYVRPPQGGAPADDDPRRCTAKSQQSGERCRRWAMEGQKVCPFHGGGSKLARNRGQINLMEMLGTATAVHRRILKESKDERVLLKAVEMVYDRTGLDKVTSAIEGEAVRQMVKARLIDTLNGVPSDDAADHEEDIVEGVVVEDELGDIL